jgi:response regulator RpfG family c-di-GMP phosphodiesterase
MAQGNTVRSRLHGSVARTLCQSGDGMRILLVDDEPALRELWADVLREHGYAVDLAGTLSEAQDCLGELHPVWSGHRL